MTLLKNSLIYSQHSYTFLHSFVCCLSSVSQWCTLLKPFNWYSCHLAGALVRSSDPLCQIGVHDPQEKRRLWRLRLSAKTCSCKLQPNCQFSAVTWRVQKRRVILPFYQIAPVLLCLVCCTLPSVLMLL